MANPKFTRRTASALVLMRIGSGNWSSKDKHLTVGRGSGSKSDWIGRAEFRIPEPSNDDWPDSGKLVRALMTVTEATTPNHPEFDGNDSRASIRRLDQKPGLTSAEDRDGYYSQQGSGDLFPGSSMAGAAVEFDVRGSETRDVSSLIEAMLPTRIKKRNGDPGGNQLYGYFMIQSTNEDNHQRSFTLNDDITLVVEIKVAVTPDAPTILEVIGAQEGTSGPAVVGSADGRTLEVRFSYNGAAGDVAAKAELALYGPGASDARSGAVTRTTGSVTPVPGGATGTYLVKMTGAPIGAEGRFRIRTTSQQGEQGDWSSLDDDDSHVQLAVVPGPPLDIVFQPYTDDPHIQFSLNSPDPADFLTGGEAEVTLLPQGTLAWASGMDDIGGTTRRADLVYNGVPLPDGQRVSYRVRTRNAEGVTGLWSAPLTQTVHEPQDVTFAPAPGRLTTRVPTITLSFPLADGARLWLVDPVDDAHVIYDSGGVPLTNQTSHAFAVPAGVLAWGQRFRAKGAYIPDGTTAYTDPSELVGYSVASLPTSIVTVPDAYRGRVDTEDPEYLRTITDPDGASVFLIDQELRVAATPQGSGAYHTRFLGGPAGPVAIPGGTVTFETAVDVRIRARNDADALAATTLNGALSAGATGATLTSGSGFVTGQDIVIASTVSGETEVRQATIAGTAASWTDPLEHAHASGQAVNARAFGPWSPWLTITAMEPPEVDLISPIDGATITDPTAALVWGFTGHGGRTHAGSVVRFYAGGDVIASVDVGALLTADIPAYLLDHDQTYGWDVTSTDSAGMVATSAVYAFDTVFAEPVPITVLTGTVDDDGNVLLAWDPGGEPYVHHYEVVWIADDGSPVRIDDGPREALDGRIPMSGTTMTHIGARLGANTYHVSVSNGWRSSEPVSAVVVLTRRGSPHLWCLVDEAGNVRGLTVTSASMPHSGTIERFLPPGGIPRQLTWGGEARGWSLSLEMFPGTDEDLLPALRAMQDSGAGQWVKAPAGYRVDPLWAAVQSFTPAPREYGLLAFDLELLELGDPVHAIIPEAPEPPEVGEPDASIVESFDFGDVEVP